MDFTKNAQAFKKLEKPKAVIFDWDNTLADTWPLIAIAINNTMRAMNKEEWNLQKVKDTVHKSMRESFPIIFGDDWVKAGEVYKNSYRSMHLEDLKLLPGALELLKTLEEKNILVCLISNKIGATLRREIKALNIQNYFFSVIGSMDASVDKPNSAPFELALLGSGIDPKKDHIWFVGDTIADIDCAYNTGTQPIVYGLDGGISKTIPYDLMQNGKRGQATFLQKGPGCFLEENGALPLYFDHLEMIELLKRF